MQARLSTMFQSLQVRNYRLFAFGQLVKLIGVWMMFIAQDWLVLELSGDSATALGVVVALQFTPVLLLTLLSGRLADRYDKRMLLFVANAFWTVLSLAMSVLVLTDLVQLWHVFVFAALLGVANAMETPVRQAFVSELVGTALLPNALSLNAAVFNSARIVGPAVAGLAIAAFDVGPVFLVTALSSIAPLVTVIRMRSTELHREPLPARGERAAATVLDGLRYVARRPDLLLPMVVMSVIGMSLFNFQLTLAALAKTVFNTGAASFGLFSTTLAAARWSVRWPEPGGAAALGVAGAGRRDRLRHLRHARRAGPGVLDGGRPVAADRLLHGLFRPGGESAGATRHRRRLPRTGDGAVGAGVPRHQPGRAPIIGWVAETFGAGASIWAGGLLSLTTALLALAWQLRRAGARLRFRVLPLPRFYVTEM